MSVDKLTQDTPPKFFTRLLDWSLPNELKEPVIGDLWEEYFQRLQSSGAVQTNYRFGKQSFKTSLKFIFKTQMGLLMFIFSLILFVGLTLMAMVMGGDLGMFVNVPSIMIILPSFFFAIGITSLKSFKLGMRSMYSTDISDDLYELSCAKAAFSIFGNSAILLGFMATFIGAIAMASHIESEEFAKVFGPALAVCLLCIFYASVIKVLTYVVEKKLEMQILFIQR